MEKSYHVYVLASRSHALYTGVTNDLMSRVGQHREGKVSSFTAKYRIHRLVYFETFREVRAARAREKQIKSRTREKRAELIQETTQRGSISLRTGFLLIREKQVPRLRSG